MAGARGASLDFVGQYPDPGLSTNPTGDVARHRDAFARQAERHHPDRRRRVARPPERQRAFIEGSARRTSRGPEASRRRRHRACAVGKQKRRPALSPLPPDGLMSRHDGDRHPTDIDQSALDGIVPKRLRPVAAGFAALFFLRAGGHGGPDRNRARRDGAAGARLGDRPGRDRLPRAVAAAPARTAHRPRRRRDRAGELPGACASPARDFQTTNVLLIVIGIGAFFLSWRWFMLAIGTTLLSWTIVATTTPLRVDAPLSHWSFSLCPRRWSPSCCTARGCARSHASSACARTRRPRDRARSRGVLRRGGDAREVRVPRDDEPRAAHADERRDRHDEACCSTRRSSARAARAAGSRRAAASRCSRSSTTSPTLEDRGRAASSSREDALSVPHLRRRVGSHRRGARRREGPAHRVARPRHGPRRWSATPCGCARSC